MHLTVVPTNQHNEPTGALSDEGIDANCSGSCDARAAGGTEHGSKTGQAVTEPTPGTATDLSHYKACSKHANVELTRTLSTTRFSAGFLAVCAYDCF